MQIREYLKEHTLLFDGAFGTYYTKQFRPEKEESFFPEYVNISRPDRVKAIHRKYLSAGAHAIKTNTFGAYPGILMKDAGETKKLITAGFSLAEEALLNHLSKDVKNRPETTGEFAKRAGQERSAEASGEEDYFIFADLGPAPGEEENERILAYQMAIDSFLETGARYFLFETLPEEKTVLEAIRYLKDQCPGAYAISSFAVMPDGFSSEGCNYRDMLAAAAGESAVDAVGLNCMSSVWHMDHLIRQIPDPGKPLLLMPNAGYPVVRGYRTVFEGNADYFARILARDAGQGVAMVGGCCGTTPDHIRLLADRLREKSVRHQEGQGPVFKGPDPALGQDHGKRSNQHLYAVTGSDGNSSDKDSSDKGSSDKGSSDSGLSDRDLSVSKDQDAFYQKLMSGRKVVAVELDSPRGCDITRFMEAAENLKEAGADIITIADNPIAKARMDSSIVAGIIRRQVGLDALPHMTCRDRNLNATKSLLLGNYAQGIRNVLVITGDPIPSARRDEVKVVYQFNSRKLMAYMKALGQEEGTFPSPMHIFGALNVNARNFEIELDRAREKVQAGAVGFLTQPALTTEAIANICRASETLRAENSRIRLLGGIIPVISERNGRFMQSEISGIDVPDALIERYVGKDRADCEEIAVDSSLELAKTMEDAVDGYYLVTPFMRDYLIRRIMERLPGR